MIARVTMMQGMGDAVWQRPALQHLLTQYDLVYALTAWPQLYEDLDPVRLKLLRPSGLSGSRMYYMVDRYTGYHKEPWRVVNHHAIRLYYHVPDCVKPIIPSLFERAYAPADTPYKLELPRRWDHLGEALRAGRKIAVVRPPTVRKEWPCPARCGDTAAYQQVVTGLGATDYHVIEVGTVCEDEPLFGQPLYHGGDRYLHGELSPEQLWGLIAVADLVVTGPCNILPLAMAYDRQIIGIWGGYEAPWLTVHDYKKIHCLVPEPFTPVPDPDHVPNRVIAPSAIQSVLEEVCLARA